LCKRSCTESEKLRFEETKRTKLKKGGDGEKKTKRVTRRTREWGGGGDEEATQLMQVNRIWVYVF